MGRKLVKSKLSQHYCSFADLFSAIHTIQVENSDIRPLDS